MDMRKIVGGATGAQESSCLKEVDPVTGRLTSCMREIDPTTGATLSCVKEVDPVD